MLNLSKSFSHAIYIYKLHFEHRQIYELFANKQQKPKVNLNLIRLTSSLNLNRNFLSFKNY